jgi:hypothetical protein
MKQKIASTTGFDIPHDLQKLWEEDEHQVLKLIIQGGPSSNTSLPGQRHAPQLFCGSWNHHSQIMAETDNQQSPWDPSDPSSRAIALQLFHAFRMHGLT